MKLICDKASPPREGALEVQLFIEDDAPPAAFRVAGPPGSPTITPAVIDIPSLAPHLELVERLLAALCDTRRYYGAAPPHPARNTPEWFDPAPLMLVQLRALDDTSYELRFEEPDGTVRMVNSKALLLHRDEQSLWGVETQTDKELYQRLPMRPMNAAIVAMHKLRRALGDAALG
jgi:hypothetical protein